MRRRIEEQWTAYAKQCAAAGASPGQIQAARQAFWMGAGVMFNTIMGELTPGVEPTDENVNAMDEINTELNEYGHGLTALEAKP